MPAAVAETKTRSLQVASDVTALLRARTPLIWIKTAEEARVEANLIPAITAAGYLPRFWDVSQGVQFDLRQKPDPALKMPPALLARIRLDAMNYELPSTPESDTRKVRGAWILRDLPDWLTGQTNLVTLREVRNLARLLPSIPLLTAQAMIVLTTNDKVPPQLAGHATVIDWPLPDRREIGAMLDDAIESTNASLAAANQRPIPVTSVQREAGVDAALGLMGEEAQACFALSMSHKRIDVKLISNEKKRIVSRDGLLTWYDPEPEGLDAIGGLDVLKSWLEQRKLAWAPKAREYGLRAPRGVMLVGVQGCGKSLSAKSVPTSFNVPLIKLDLGALKGGIVGESERNLRKAINTIESVGKCVVWIDEIEKALAGAINGARDGGVSADVLGYILTWMQERKGEAFIVMTSNDISALPPELLRKPRIDEIFFVDLPNINERVEILKAALRTFKRGALKIKHEDVAAVCDKFTGSEVAELVPNAMFTAFAANGRELTTNDLIEAARAVVPLSKTMGEKITGLREWVKEGRAKLATSPLIIANKSVPRHNGRRQIDFANSEEND